MESANASRAYWVFVAVPLAALTTFYFYPLAKVLVLSVTVPQPGFANFQKLADSEAIRTDLRQRTARAVEVGVFGAPAFVVGDQLFWGQDRIPLVVRAAQGWRPDPQYDNFRF
mgnify:CR=1 FL=1